MNIFIHFLRWWSLYSLALILLVYSPPVISELYNSLRNWLKPSSPNVSHDDDSNQRAVNQALDANAAEPRANTRSSQIASLSQPAQRTENQNQQSALLFNAWHARSLRSAANNDFSVGAESLNVDSQSIRANRHQ